MAINTIMATIQMRRGLEQDFDADKMVAGEWAVSTDNKYVRMCFAPGIVLRMATYEAFEADMVQIQTILAACQDIQVAVDAMASLAEQHKNDAEASKNAAAQSEANADNYAKLSKSYAVGTNGEVREGDATDNSGYYYEQCKRLAQGLNGLIPMGTISFAELDDPNNQQTGYMFNISDSFVSDDRFADGGGIFYGAGSNLVYTAQGLWDVLAASMVAGVKGSEEAEYRQGFVNITRENLGIGIATEPNPGLVKPDGTTTVVDPDGTIHVVGNEGTLNYNDLDNRPAVNGVTLEGEKTSEDLKIMSHKTQEEYDALPDTKFTDNVLYLTEDESSESNVVGLVDINEAINGVVLWENPNPSSEFPAQTVTLSDSIEKYEYVEVVYLHSINTMQTLASGRVPFSDNLILRLLTFDGNNYFRLIRNFVGTEVSISNTVYYPTYGSGAENMFNAGIIPIKIIGYPKADFAAIDGVIPDAKSVSYDNSNSGLAAGNVQDAVDEMMEYKLITSIENVSTAIQVLSFCADKKRGIVHLTLYVTAKGFIGENDVLFTLPKGFRPKQSYYLAGILYQGSLGSENRYPYARIRESGAVAISAVPGQYLMVDTTYIADF